MTAARAQRAPGRGRGLAALAAAYGTALLVALVVGGALRGHHPILVAAAADVAATVTVFAFSVLHDNASIYDPYWSVAPVGIALYWGSSAPAAAGTGARRAWVLAIVCAWGLRLTANQLARWRGLADEDFRYVELRRRAGRWYWPVSLVAVHLAPTAWVFLGLLAAYPALAGRGGGPGILDAVAAAVAGGGVVLEAVADGELRRFVRARRDPGEVLASGVWALSRHPNYLGELLFWWGLFLAGVAAAPGWAWTVVGPLAITALLAGVSVPWMDRRMAARHPQWTARTRGVPALVPWPGGRRRASARQPPATRR